MLLSDELRAGTQAMLQELRALGIERIVQATGDRREVAAAVAAGVSIDLVRSELTPDQKILVVLSERKNGPVMMIGDGVNDAPALAAADIGLAMGVKGAAASAEAADVVLLVDQLDRVLPAIRIARRSRFIAVQSVVAGMGALHPRHDRGGVRLPRASRGRAAAGSDRRGGHLQRAAGAARLAKPVADG
jgi:P-type E1-E2 ATPase